VFVYGTSVHNNNKIAEFRFLWILLYGEIMSEKKKGVCIPRVLGGGIIQAPSHVSLHIARLQRFQILLVPL
jgi:hypothetical protein